MLNSAVLRIILVKLTCDHAMPAIETDLDHTQCSTSLWRLTYDLLVESVRQSSVRVNVAMWVVGATEARHVERLENFAAAFAVVRLDEAMTESCISSGEAENDRMQGTVIQIACRARPRSTLQLLHTRKSLGSFHICVRQFVESAKMECRPQGRSQTERHRAASLATGLQSDSFFSAEMRCITFMAPSSPSSSYTDVSPDCQPTLMDRRHIRLCRGPVSASTVPCETSATTATAPSQCRISTVDRWWTAETSTTIVMLWLELDENAACKVLKQTTFKSVRKTISKTRPKP